MPENENATTVPTEENAGGIWDFLDKLGDAADGLTDIYDKLVKAGIIKKEPPAYEVPPLLPEVKPLWKTVLPIGLGLAAVGGGVAYYTTKRKRK